MLILVADISYYWQELDDTSAIILVELIVFSLFPGLVQKWTASALFVDSSISKNSLEKLNVRMSPCGIVVNCKFHRTFPFFNSKWIGQIFLSFVTLESFHFTFSPPEYRTHHLVLLQNTSLGIIGLPPECLSGLTWSTLSGDPIFDIDSSTSVCHSSLTLKTHKML